jgi:hypothetical protein
MPRTAAVLALVAAHALSGCGDPAGPADELARNRARWAAEGFGTYEFGFRRFCFCPDEALAPVQIEVAGSAVVAVIDALGQPVDSLAVARYFTITIDSLFGVVEHAIEVHAYRLSVRYNAQFGYPELILVDYDAATADEELGFSASLLVPFSIP